MHTNVEALVSVIVPIYKVEKYLDRCVQSIVDQTYTNIEIILVDDGSPDNCPQMCDAWADRDDRIKVIHKQNEGLGMARNSGMEIAGGEYWMFVDSDDYITPNAVQVLLERIIADGSDLAMGKHTDLYEDGSTNGSFCEWMQDEIISLTEVYLYAATDHYLPVSAWAKLYRKELLDGFVYPTLKCGEDLWIFPDIIERCRKISIVNEPIYFYYQRADSLVHKKTEIARMDEIHANLKYAKILFQKKYYASAGKWYSRSVEQTALLMHKAPGRELLHTYFNAAERKKLMKETSLKIRIKWCCVYIPGLYTILRSVNRIWRYIF